MEDQDYSDSEEEWDEDELQETSSDMQSDNEIMNDNEDVEDEDKSDEFAEDEDEIGEVVQNEDKSDELVEDDTPTRRTIRSGKTYAQVVETGIEYTRESGLFLARVMHESRSISIDKEGSHSQQYTLTKALKKLDIEERLQHKRKHKNCMKGSHLSLFY